MDDDDGCADSRHHWFYTEEHARGEIKCAKQVGANVMQNEWKV
jgi:hypothetical protein